MTREVISVAPDISEHEKEARFRRKQIHQKITDKIGRSSRLNSRASRCATHPNTRAVMYSGNVEITLAPGKGKDWSLEYRVSGSLGTEGVTLSFNGKDEPISLQTFFKDRHGSELKEVDTYGAYDGEIGALGIVKRSKP